MLSKSCALPSCTTPELERLSILVTILSYIVSKYINRDLIVWKIMPLISLVRPRKFSSFYCLLKRRNKTIIHRCFYSIARNLPQATDGAGLPVCSFDFGVPIYIRCQLRGGSFIRIHTDYSSGVLFVFIPTIHVSLHRTVSLRQRYMIREREGIGSMTFLNG